MTHFAAKQDQAAESLVLRMHCLGQLYLSDVLSGLNIGFVIVCNASQLCQYKTSIPVAYFKTSSFSQAQNPAAVGSRHSLIIAAGLQTFEKFLCTYSPECMMSFFRV